MDARENWDVILVNFLIFGNIVRRLIELIYQ